MGGPPNTPNGHHFTDKTLALFILSPACWVFQRRRQAVLMWNLHLQNKFFHPFPENSLKCSSSLKHHLVLESRFPRYIGIITTACFCTLRSCSEIKSPKGFLGHSKEAKCGANRRKPWQSLLSLQHSCTDICVAVVFFFKSPTRWQACLLST